MTDEDIPTGLIYLSWKGNKLRTFSSHTWGRNEQPLWLSRCIYRDSKSSMEKSGVMMLTRGALYIFRDKLLRGYVLRGHHNLFKFTKIQQLANRIILTYQIVGEAVRHEPKPNNDVDDVPLLNENPENQMNIVESPYEEHRLSLEFKGTETFTILLHRIISELFYGINSIPFPSFEMLEGKILERPTKIPKNSLLKKAIAFAHSEVQWGRNLSIANYLRFKWNGEKVLCLGKKFNPQYYSAAFGTAVGMESTIDTVVFKNCAFDGMETFLNRLMKSSISIKLVVFVNYMPNIKPKFAFDGSNTIVTRWHFVNCCADTVCNFLAATSNFSSPPEEIAIARRSYNEKDSARIIQAIKDSPMAYRTDTLQFVDTRFRNFPFDDFSVLISDMPLNTFVFRHINIEGSQLFAALCKTRPLMRSLKLQKLSFTSPVDPSLKLPAGLVLIDISESEFIAESFTTFMLSICREEVKNPFILNAAKLKITESEFEIFKVYMDQCEKESNRHIKSNILELNLSDIYLPVVGVQEICRFIRTQKKLTQISLENISCPDPTVFTREIVAVLQQVKTIKGIDFTLHLGEDLSDLLFRYLAFRESITRIIIKNCGIGNKGMTNLMARIPLFTNLEEIACDGSNPSPVNENEKIPLIEFWKTIANTPSIVANDFPYQDLNTLGLDENAIPEKERMILKSRRKPYTQNERIELIMKKVIDDERKAIQESIM